MTRRAGACEHSGPSMQPTPLGPDALRRVAPFGSLPDAAFAAFLVCARARSFRRGAVVLREGQPGSFLVLVTEGDFVVTARGPGGEALEVGRIGPGETAGEMAFLDPGRRTATVTAASDGAGYEIDYDAMDVLRRNAPAAACAVISAALRSVARRLRRLDDRIEGELAALGPVVKDPR
jgi:CRP/FNR family transcriptional regulator, cyclic AMP receptor protein